METNSNSSNMKSLERVVSEKALKLGSSFPCQICVVGFLCGVCLTSLFLAALTSLGIFELGGISFSAISSGISPCNSTSQIINMVSSIDRKLKLKETGKWVEVETSESKDETGDDQINLLVSAWDDLLIRNLQKEETFFEKFGLKISDVPHAPHLENCEVSAHMSKRLDTRAGNETFPPWMSWRGQLDMHPMAAMENEQLKHYRRQASEEGLYPPWINGADEENYPLTRKVQRDIWIHQHPLDCKNLNVKFLVADWETLPGFGIGAQIAGMTGLLAIAIKEKRVLVTNYYNRADHNSCKGSSRSNWSCYFFPEASQECRDRAFELMKKKEAWEMGIITGKHNYSSKEIWAGSTPRLWGEPWSYMQPTTEINGSFILVHRKMDRRWWRAQAVRYLMRYPTEYTCGLMNVARHAAFGKDAAKIVLSGINKNWPKEIKEKKKSEIEEFVWSNHKPWTPRPLLSIHVRMGDKACEMKIVSFGEYMRLAVRIRNRFPHLQSIWLSTEMQDVIDRTKDYPNWKFYYTNVRRQVGNTSMASYEASLGRETSTNNPLVNFLMASEADFFIGALGSTWCFLIDGMRNTGGKVMSGYLSVNKDRFW